MSETPQPTAAGPTRGTDGTILNQSPPPPTSTDTTTPVTEQTEPVEKPAASLLNGEPGEPTETPAGAPEAYEPFTAHESWATKGWELDAEKITSEIAPVFKELNLSQEQGQKLIDLYTKVSGEAADHNINLAKEQNDKWAAEANADPELRGKLGQVKQNVAKMFNLLNDPPLETAFREAMDFTGAGNHPAFIKVMNRLAQRLTEGTPVQGGKPSPGGQKQPGATGGSAASRIWPGLPSGTG
jgi:hypothetical protein